MKPRDSKGRYTPVPVTETVKKQRLEQRRANWRAYYRRKPEFMKARNAKRYTHLNPHQMWELHLKQAYDMSVDDYWALWEAQHGACAICETPSDFDLVVDHDPASHTNRRRGKPRGLLCHRCNTGLGKFKDDPTMLRKAAAYVSKHHNR